MCSTDEMVAEIIAIGSELLTPHRTDTNSLFITDHLNRIGIEVVLRTIVGDDRERLTQALALALQRSDIIITSGGLGPTEDDLTRECAAAALGKTMYRDSSLLNEIEERFRSRGLTMPSVNLRQSMVIEGAQVLRNPRGTAPGQWINHDGKMLILLPGPPRELQPMFEEICIPLLQRTGPPSVLLARSLRITGLTESAVEELAAPIYTQYNNPVTTILASPGDVQLHLRAKASQYSEAKSLLDELSCQLEAKLRNYIYSTNGDCLEKVVGNLLHQQGQTLAVAESCTGGLLAERITDVPGSSDYFLGGFVCYSDSWKLNFLDVPADVLEKHGAVSEPVARLLAEGVRKKAGSTYGIGITGIAGPSGSTPSKPVGLVYLALAAPKETQVLQRLYPGEREIIRWQSTQAALDMLRRMIVSTMK